MLVNIKGCSYPNDGSCSFCSKDMTMLLLLHVGLYLSDLQTCFCERKKKQFRMVDLVMVDSDLRMSITNLTAQWKVCNSLIPTLRTPWSWQKYCLKHCARTCCSLRNVTRCRFTNWRIRCERGGRNVHFLSINLISFRRSRGIVLVKLGVFRSQPNPHCHWQRHWQSASSLVRCLWLARLVSVWKVPPGDVTARSE